MGVPLRGLLGALALCGLGGLGPASSTGRPAGVHMAAAEAALDSAKQGAEAPGPSLGRFELGARGTAYVAGEEGLSAKVALQEDGHVLVTVHRAPHELAGGEAKEKQLTWHETIRLLRADGPALRELLSQVLERLPFDAYYWECPPVSRKTAKDRFFSFVALPSQHLASIEADAGPFSEHLAPLRGQLAAKAFFNLGGDSLLVAPAEAVRDQQAYAHIGNFFRRAPPAQRDALWRELGRSLQGRLESLGAGENVWVSTEGSGVYWLHLRMDPMPKYYHHQPFRNPQYGLPREEL